MICTYYDKSQREKVVTIYADDRTRIADVVNIKKNGKWLWECRKCNASDCDHVAQARRFVMERKREQKKRWEATAPVESVMPRKRFAPVGD